MNVEVNEDELRYKKKFTNYIVWYLVVLTLLGFSGIFYVLLYDSFMGNIGRALVGIDFIAILILILFLLAFFVFKKKQIIKIVSTFKIITIILTSILGVSLILFGGTELGNYIKQKRIINNNEIVVTFASNSIFNVYYDTYLINNGKFSKANVPVRLKSDYNIEDYNDCNGCILKEDETIIYSITNGKRHFYIVKNNTNYNRLLYEYKNNQLVLIIDGFKDYGRLTDFYAK